MRCLKVLAVILVVALAGMVSGGADVCAQAQLKRPSVRKIPKKIPEKVPSVTKTGPKVILPDLFIERAELDSSDCRYTWNVTLWNRSGNPLTGLTIAAQQRRSETEAWKQIALMQLGSLSPDQRLERSIMWYRNPLAAQARVVVKKGSEDMVSTSPRELPEVSLNIVGLELARLKENTFTWVAQVKNEGSCPVCSLKGQPYKKRQIIGWVPAGSDATAARIDPGENKTLAGTWNAIEAERFRIMVSARQNEQSASLAPITMTSRNFTAQNTPDIGDRISFSNINITQDPDCSYNWNFTVTNNSGWSFADDLVVFCRQRRILSGPWDGAGARMISPLPAGQTKSVSISGPRDPEAIKFEIGLKYDGDVIKAEPLAVPPLSVSVTDLQVSPAGGSAYDWSAAIKNNTDYAVCDVSVGVYKPGTMGWETAAPPEINLTLSANGTLWASGTFTRQADVQYKLMVQGKGLLRYPGGSPYQPNVKLAEKTISF